MGIWGRFVEFFELSWLKFTVTGWDFVEYCQVVWRYYPNRFFRAQDLALIRSYFFHNPYRICRRYLEKKKVEDPYLYGETPLTTMEKIAKECQIQKQDLVYELGCGRGRSCFWLHAFVGCRVIGIEEIFEFVDKAQKIKEKFQVQGVEFHLGDLLTADYQGATVFYLYGTCFDDEFIQALIEKLTALPAGVKIITVSYPLTDYTDQSIFSLVKQFPGHFNWGDADLYLQVRK